MTQRHLIAALLALATAFAVRAESTTKISGKAYVDYTYRDNHDDGRDVAADRAAGTSLDLKRFYLGVDHSFDDVWSARIRTDVGNLTNGKYDVFVKHAFVQATVAPALYLRAGAADLPWVPFVEDLYGYRWIENVLIDRTKFGTSADWGLHAGGTVGAGLVSYAFSAVNGRGYGDPTRTQSPMVEGRVSVVPLKGLTLAVGADSGKLGQNVVGVATPNTARRFDVLAAWVAGPLRLGATAFLAKNFDKAIVTGAAPTDEARGASVWGSFAVTPAVSLFARGDYVEPHRDTSPDTKDTYVNGGIAFKPAKPIDLALVYKHEQVKSGQLSTSNGTIGSTIAGESGTYDEVGIFGQYSF